MAIEYTQLRHFVFAFIRTHRSDQVNLGFIRRQAELLGLTYTDEDALRTLDVFHDLYREGVIASGSSPNSLNVMSWPFFRVTDHGRAALDAVEYTPYDPDGYLAQLRRDVPDIQETTIRYLEEALGCFRAGFMLATAVMTGCAAEQVMLATIDAFGSALADTSEKERFQAAIAKQWMIARKYGEFIKLLQKKMNALPTELAEDLSVILDRVFDLIRAARNDAGHPTGKTVERETVRANFILFPTYCKRLHALAAHCRTASIP